MSVKHCALAVLLIVNASVIPMAFGASGLEYPIAGTQPSQRPAGAPQVSEVVKPEGWYAEALYGISKPYPSSLKFLEDQGNWYTPFNRPGMGGRYDIRGW